MPFLRSPRCIFPASWFGLAICLATLANAQEQTLWRAAAVQPSTLVKFADEKFVFEIDGQEEALATADFQRFGSWTDVRRGAQVLLVDGSTLVGDVLKITDEQLILGDATGLGRCRFDNAALPLNKILGVIYQPAAERLERDKQREHVLTYQNTSDSLRLVGGESITGLLLGSKPSAGALPDGGPLLLQFQPTAATKTIEVHPGRVAAFSFNAALIQLPVGPPNLWLGLRDGNSLSLRSLTIAGEKVVLKLAAGIELQTPLKTDDELTPLFTQAVTYLEPLATNVTYLSDLEPTDYKSVPFLSLTWPYKRDRSVFGGRLRSATGIARKGIGMHAQASIEYDIPPGSTAFAAEVAIDEIAAKVAAAQARVSLRPGPDEPWQEVVTTPILRRGDQPNRLNIPLHDARQIRLEALPADDGNNGDAVDWLFARFVREPQ